MTKIKNIDAATDAITIVFFFVFFLFVLAHEAEEHIPGFPSMLEFFHRGKYCKRTFDKKGLKI